MHLIRDLTNLFIDQNILIFILYFSLSLFLNEPIVTCFYFLLYTFIDSMFILFNCLDELQQHKNSTYYNDAERPTFFFFLFLKA